ncbi:hypothetical protein ABI59_00905 [Acidobacteria bacterium Mor1]|nr:hypothetical protein ABI59_00905 [Acidobacteria bacterium Mor1]
MSAQSDIERARQAFDAGRAAIKAGNPAAAADSFRESARLAPQNPRPLLQLGLALSALGDGDGALEAYRGVVRLDPDHARAHNNIGNVLLRRGDHAEALEAYRRATEVDRDYLLAWYHRGWISRQLNRPEEAEQAFLRCLEIPVKTPEEGNRRLQAGFFLGALRFRAGAYEEAAGLMEQVIALAPEHREAHYYLGQSYLRLGRVDEAKRELKLHQELVEANRTGDGAASGADL